MLYVSLPLPPLIQQFTPYNHYVICVGRTVLQTSPCQSITWIQARFVNTTVDSVLSVRTLFERVFKVKMKEVGVENDESWCRPRVRKFAFYDVDSSEPLGHVYLDLYVVCLSTLDNQSKTLFSQQNAQVLQTR